MLSKQSGVLYDDFTELGVSIRIQENIADESLLPWIEKNYDEVLVNTLQMCGMIYMLNGRDITVKWWIHEPPAFFSCYREVVPQEFWNQLAGNIRIFSAGNVYDYILGTFGKQSDVLNFGVEDVVSQVSDIEVSIASPDKVTFLLPSTTIQPLKGQDVMALAIISLPDEYDAKAEFIFVGNEAEGLEEYYDNIKYLESVKENVKLFNVIPREELLNWMKQADCIVAPSREDTTNACIVEGMMLSKVCLCSDAAGISRYMEDCVNGFVFASCNVDELRDRIMLIIDNIGRLSVIEQNGRKIYEKDFCMEVFGKNVEKYW